jgi:hypothetical protein
MDHIGIDVHKKESQICILAEGGELIAQRICTEPERFTAVLGEPWKASVVSPSAILVRILTMRGAKGLSGKVVFRGFYGDCLPLLDKTSPYSRCLHSGQMPWLNCAVVLLAT